MNKCKPHISKEQDNRSILGKKPLRNQSNLILKKIYSEQKKTTKKILYQLILVKKINKFVIKSF